MKKAIETAIKMETDAIAFYKEAAKNTKHAFGREMFKGFVKDETRHLKMLKNIFKGLAIEADFHRPKKTVQTVFSKLKSKMMERVKVMDDEMEAVKIALKFEKEGYNFYKKAASKAKTKEERDLFERLVIEENDHFTILNETYNFMDNTGQWYMYEERGILEG